MTFLTSVCISKVEESPPSVPIPFVNLAGDLPGYDIQGITKAYSAAWQQRDWKSSLDYIQYLAEKRNRAVEIALEKHPMTTDILMIDSYYLKQTEAILRLIEDYERVNEKTPLILGGAVWGKQRTRISHLLKPPSFAGKDWYDKWGVPELRWTPWHWWPPDDWLAFRMRVPILGFYRTAHTSGIFIFPRTVWDKGARFAVYEDLRSVELAPFLDKAGLPVYIDFNAAFERGLVYSVIKCIRCSLGLGRFLPTW